MEDWEYNEIFEAIREDYSDYLKLNKGHQYAIARTINDYINLGKVEDFIVDTAVGELLLFKDKIFDGYVEGITRRLSMFKDIEGTNELTQEEREDLANRIENVLDGLSKVKIDYNPYSKQLSAKLKEEIT